MWTSLEGCYSVSTPSLWQQSRLRVLEGGTLQSRRLVSPALRSQVGVPRAQLPGTCRWHGGGAGGHLVGWPLLGLRFPEAGMFWVLAVRAHRLRVCPFCRWLLAPRCQGPAPQQHPVLWVKKGAGESAVV